MNHLPHEEQIIRYQETIADLKSQTQETGVGASKEISALEGKLDDLKKEVYGNLSAWERVMICRHPQRPHSLHYIETIFDDFYTLSGDRITGEDSAIIGGIGRIGEQSFMVVGQEKGHDTQTRVERNFGMPHPEGYRKALRLFQMAEKFSLPIVTFLDTPGAFPGLEAEERGQGWAIAHNLREMMRIETPIIVIVIGEGCSGGALGMGVGDVVGMLEHAYYSVISPEGCASILYKDPTKNTLAAEMLKLNAEHLEKYGIIDEIIREPLGGAHRDAALTIERVQAFIEKEQKRLSKLSKTKLLDQRYKKFRAMGEFEEQVMNQETTS